MSQSMDEYEAGDINVVEDSEPDDEAEYEPGDINTLSPEAGNGAEGATAATTSVAVLRYLARSLSNEPEAVVVQTESRRSGVRLRLRVASSDMGRVIGRRGRTAQAIRTLVGAAGTRDGVQTTVDIVDD